MKARVSPQAVPDPTLRENLEKCCGRGILLMEAYMNACSGAGGTEGENDQEERRGCVAAEIAAE